MAMMLNAADKAASHDWKLCAKWINLCGCLPPTLQTRLMSDDLTLSQFANALRDGEILCNVINFLQPGTIDPAAVNKRAQMSQILCLNNIRLFVDACKQAPFGLKEKDLFDPQMLYDLDLPRVIRALSILSKCSTATGVPGFELISTDESHNSVDDIYYNIPPIEPTNSDNEGPECYYTDESFLLGASGGPHSNDSHDAGVYQMIVQQPQNNNSNDAGANRLSNKLVPAKRDFVIREIVNTEDNFIKGLDILADDFLAPLSKHLSESDRRCICMNIDSIVKLHKSLYAELYQACKGGAGRTVRICSVFEKFKEHMMREYAEYFASMDRSLKKCDSLSSGPINLKHHNNSQTNVAEFRQKLEECRSKSKISFKLTDLLRLPYQRILKYHLLFNELLKQTEEEHRAKEVIKKTRDSMCEVGNYLNECQRDKEILDYIEKVMSHLSGDFKMPPGTTLKDYGRHIKDDNVRIKSFEAGERLAHTRTVFLFEKALLICKSKGESYSYKETLLVSEFALEEMAAATGIVKSFDLSSNHNGSASSISNSNIAGGGANAHSFLLVNADRTRSYGFYFKNAEQKRTWKQSFVLAKEKIQPPGQCDNSHRFMLFNFDRDLVVCHVCKMFLHGIFYQGYKCDLCGSFAHKQCLTKTNPCSASSFQEPSASRIAKALTSSITDATGAKFKNHSSSTSLDRQSSNLTRQTPYIVRALYSYDGRPPPPETPVLVFKEGELIQVVDDDDDEWWKGHIHKNRPVHTLNIKIKEQEGYFPRAYVKLTNTVNMEEFAWFAPVDRTVADLILNRISNPDHQTIFMVRCRQEGGYAISIKYNGLVEHIKINLNYLDPSTHAIVPQQVLQSIGNESAQPSSTNTNTNAAAVTGKGSGGASSVTPYFSIDQRHFSSVISLVSFYTSNMLKENFPQLETTLGLAYREALPAPIGLALARYDYSPTAVNSEQIGLTKGQIYYIISKEPNGWWRVFNADGLIGFAPSNFLQELKENETA